MCIGALISSIINPLAYSNYASVGLSDKPNAPGVLLISGHSQLQPGLIKSNYMLICSIGCPHLSLYGDNHNF